jgi:hypothetical protein
MSEDVMQKVKKLPLEKQQEVEDFVDYLLNKYVGEPGNGNNTEVEEDLAERRKRNMGRLKGKIWISDDFNDTPEDFKDYL